MAEVEMGFLEGPFFSGDAVTEKLETDTWSMTPRLILFQGEEKKPRVIDNFRASNQRCLWVFFVLGLARHGLFELLPGFPWWASHLR